MAAEVASSKTPQDEGVTSTPQAIGKPTFLSPLRNSTDVRDFEESSRPGKKPRLHPPPMSAAAAHAEQQQKARQSSPQPSNGMSINPASAIVNTLSGISQNATSSKGLSPTTSPANTRSSRPNSPNPVTTLSKPMAVVAENIQQKPFATNIVTSGAPVESQVLTSPISMSSIGTLEGISAAPSGLTTTVGSPLPIEEAARQASETAGTQSTSPEDPSKSFTFPAPLLHPQVNDGARRGMSLPHSATRQGTRSPSSKKHRCPYCATEFTRHHNLKSHLLTHSQEKPYVCSTCQSRFRRLHDLKRHTKLHTGERPHICPKCGRKFARGDALARHNKGPGGCAGRRASMGSFGGDDDYDGADDSMEGVVYNEPDTMDDEEGNEKRPGIRRQAPSGDDTLDEPEHYSRMPSTYPPIQGRPPGGIASGIFPPRSGYRDSGSDSSPAAIPPPTTVSYPHPTGSSSSTRHGPSAGSTIFAQNPLSESPKPLSPGHGHGHSRGIGPNEGSLGPTRSPSITHFQQPLQQGAFSRGSGGHSLSLPPTAPQLPPPHGLNPPDPRFTLPSQGGPAHPPTQPSGPPTHMSGSGPLSSHSNSLSSHGQSGHGSGETANALFAKEDRMWAVIKTLESRVNSMQDEITSLRAQLAAATQPPQARM